jgi:hypothetical protein
MLVRMLGVIHDRNPPTLDWTKKGTHRLKESKNGLKNQTARMIRIHGEPRPAGFSSRDLHLSMQLKFNYWQ